MVRRRLQSVSAAITAGHTVVPIPGPSAVITGLVASGLPTSAFVFGGFLPPKNKARRKKLEEARTTVTSTMVFYVPPHSLEPVLSDMVGVFGAQRRCCVARELTKMHESFFRGSLEGAVQYAQQGGSRGEITLLVEGSSEEEIQAEARAETSMEERLKELLEQGSSVGAASKLVSVEFSTRKREVYNIALQVQQLLHDSAAAGDAT